MIGFRQSITANGNHKVLAEHSGSSRVGFINDNDGVKEDNDGKHLSLNEAIAGGGRIKRRHNDTGGELDIEKEEGELSPNGDFKEDNFAAFRDTSTILSKETYQNRYCEGGLENEAEEEGEESAHRSSCGSENAFENGRGSGGETVDVEDRSPEEHGGVHDNKAESESEAEEDESLLPHSERFLETVKPLTKYVPATSHDEENFPRVFYGNDAFYVFFRLHQTLYSRLEEAKKKSAITINGRVQMTQHLMIHMPDYWICSTLSLVVLLIGQNMKIVMIYLISTFECIRLLKSCCKSLMNVSSLSRFAALKVHLSASADPNSKLVDSDSKRLKSLALENENTESKL